MQELDASHASSKCFHDASAVMQAGVLKLCTLLEGRSKTTLDRVSKLERSVTQLETALSHSVIDLRLLSHSSFVENLSQEPTVRLQPQALKSPVATTTDNPALDPLDELHQILVQTPEKASIAVPHVYGTDSFEQDSDLGINF